MAVDLVDPRRALEVVPRDLCLPCCDNFRLSHCFIHLIRFLQGPCAILFIFSGSFRALVGLGTLKSDLLAVKTERESLLPL